MIIYRTERMNYLIFTELKIDCVMKINWIKNKNKRGRYKYFI